MTDRYRDFCAVAAAVSRESFDHTYRDTLYTNTQTRTPIPPGTISNTTTTTTAVEPI